MAAINDGTLKARKMGNAYRISNDALEAFLNS
jgi:excisionase family DNA binding protein